MQKVHKPSYKVQRNGSGLYTVIIDSDRKEWAVTKYIMRVPAKTGSRSYYLMDKQPFVTLRDAILFALTGEVF